MELKAPELIEVTLAGIYTDVILVHDRNALLPIVVTLFGMVNDPVKPEQFRNALVPIDVTLFGMVNVPVNPVHP